MFNLFLLESLYRSFGACVLFGLLRTRELLQFSPPNPTPGTFRFTLPKFQTTVTNDPEKMFKKAHVTLRKSTANPIVQYNSSVQKGPRDVQKAHDPSREMRRNKAIWYPILHRNSLKKCLHILFIFTFLLIYLVCRYQ